MSLLRHATNISKLFLSTHLLHPPLVVHEAGFGKGHSKKKHDSAPLRSADHPSPRKVAQPAVLGTRFDMLSSMIKGCGATRQMKSVKVGLALMATTPISSITAKLEEVARSSTNDLGYDSRVNGARVEIVDD